MSSENMLILFCLYILYFVLMIFWIFHIVKKYEGNREGVEEYLVGLSFIEKVFLLPVLFQLSTLFFILEKLGLIRSLDE